MSGEVPDFTVLLGTDYAGKTTVLSALSRRGVRCVSYDAAFVRPDCSLVNDLREGFLAHALRGLGRGYSADFVLSLLQTSVVHLRDEILRADRGSPVLVDSYYYKILAKCVLTGLVNEDIFAWWRTFPRPRRIILLEVDPETAWARSGRGARANGFEYYGDFPTWNGFRRFQADLRQRMVDEVDGVEMVSIGRADHRERVAAIAARLGGRSDVA
ncbi:hypothetical protein [Amycolatopsis sp. NPDC059021]|uniref:hypothetical protein n=1 Tax=Amycolatopsis sp. NPDC059021 TaxID=3346704 RepID=UPI003672E215